MKTLLVIGCGNLTGALLLAQKRANVNQDFKYLLLSRNQDKLKKLSFSLNPLKTEIVSSYPLGQKIESVILGVKPTQLKQILLDYPDLKNTEAEIISTLGGVNITTLQKFFPKAKVHSRLMPSIVSAEINSHALAISNNLSSSLLNEWYSAIGNLLWMKNDFQVDELTLIFGSNAAFMAALLRPWMESLNIHLNDKEQSQKIMIEQMTSALEFLKNKSLDAVIEKVQTPGGITAQALEIFAQNKLELIIKDAISASGKRAKELADIVSRDLN